jgi:hypothetical protein
VKRRVPEGDRLARLLELVAREDRHLLAVRHRLLGEDCTVDANRVTSLLADDLGIDRLESFGAKFGRMQDTVVDKLIPALLGAAGESVAAAIDNLGRMERLGLIASADEWLEMRHLRNRLVQEYIERPEDLAPALERACRFTERMHADYVSMRQYVVSRLLVIDPPAGG